MALSKRLQAILSMIEPCDSLMDIGSDHALLCIAAVQNNIVNQAIAVDNKSGPLSKAKETIDELNLSELIQLVLSDGASQVEQKVDCWVIAGLGGETIIQILSDSLDKSKLVPQLILSPHSKTELVRKFLFDSGFEITKEQLVLDGKYYPILKCKYSGIYHEYTLKNLYIGKLQNDPHYEEWLKRQKKHYQQLMLNNAEFESIYQLFNQEFSRYQFQDMDKD